MDSNKKMEENRPHLKFNFTYTGGFRQFYASIVSVMAPVRLFYLYLVFINTKQARDVNFSIIKTFKSSNISFLI